MSTVSAHPAPNKRNSSNSSSHINHLRHQSLSLVIKVLRSVQVIALLNKFNYLQQGDTSSSMSGRPLEASRGTLSAVVEDDSFFGGHQHRWTPAAVPPYHHHRLLPVPGGRARSTIITRTTSRTKAMIAMRTHV